MTTQSIATLHSEVEVQCVARSLANHDIHTTCNELVDTLSRHTYVDPADGPALPTSDDLAPAMSRPDYSEAPEGYTVTQSQYAADTWQVRDPDGDRVEDCANTQRDAMIAAWEDSGDEPPHQEALQFWIVSSQLADELEAVGACVARDILGFNIWGRTECGTALEDDSDLLGVAAAMVLRTQARR